MNITTSETGTIFVQDDNLARFARVSGDGRWFSASLTSASLTGRDGYGLRCNAGSTMYPTAADAVAACISWVRDGERPCISTAYDLRAAARELRA